ncbi:MAG: beta-lactamase family protein [Oscillospiraceae bacterium]|nr:beta-lactamase family protein [Oscillospiraceae bacterium]
MTIDLFFPYYAPAKKITICNLLHHSSGIPDYISDRIIPDAICKYELEYGNPPNDILEFNRCIVPKCRPVSLSECFKLIKALPLHFEPNTKGRYSNTNYFLLGHILEMVTGKQLPIVMNETFKRFGLKHTHMNGRIADACGYVKNKNEVFSCGRPAMDSGDSSVVSSLNDFSIWCDAILNANVLTVESWKECLDFRPEPYGCGFWQFENGWFGHDGGLPGLRHWQRLNFECNTAIIILSNAVIDEPEFLTKLMNHVMQ